MRCETIAPRPSTSVAGLIPLVPELANSPGEPDAAAPASPAPPALGSGRKRSTPSTRRISPENGSPGRAPTTTDSSMVGAA